VERGDVVFSAGSYPVPLEASVSSNTSRPFFLDLPLFSTPQRGLSYPRHGILHAMNIRRVLIMIFMCLTALALVASLFYVIHIQEPSIIDPAAPNAVVVALSLALTSGYTAPKILAFQSTVSDPLTVVFKSKGMTGITGKVDIAFGDGSSDLFCFGECSDASIVHTYVAPGTYQVTLIDFSYDHSNPDRTSLLTSMTIRVQ
jgi:hypothetical protein